MVIGTKQIQAWIARITGLALLAVGCAGGTPVRDGEPKVQSLDQISTLQDLFVQDDGKVRLLILLSPT